MTKKELRELIKSVIKEYTGTGAMAASGPVSHSGNNVTSPRPFHNDEEELDNYTKKMYMVVTEDTIKMNQLRQVILIE